MTRNKITGYVFFGLLLLLAVVFMAALGAADVSAENRSLEKFPALKDANFAAKLNTYVSDRFPARTLLINQFNNFRLNQMGINTSKGEVHIGRDAWLFNLKGQLQNDKISPDVLIEELLRRQSICKNLGIESLFVVVPNKLSVYTEMALNQSLYNQNSLINKVVSQKPDQLKFLYLKEDLRAHKHKADVFHKGDHHWKYEGAFIGYQSIIRELNMSSLLSTSDFKKRKYYKYGLSSYEKLGISKQKEIGFNWVGFKYTQRLNNRILELQQQWNKPKYENNPFPIIGNDSTSKRVLILRDSYANMLATFFPNDFSEIEFLWDGWKYEFPKQILIDSKPDIFITVIAEDSLYLITQNNNMTHSVE